VWLDNVLGNGYPYSKLTICISSYVLVRKYVLCKTQHEISWKLIDTWMVSCFFIVMGVFQRPIKCIQLDRWILSNKLIKYHFDSTSLSRMDTMLFLQKHIDVIFSNGVDKSYHLWIRPSKGIMDFLETNLIGRNPFKIIVLSKKTVFCDSNNIYIYIYTFMVGKKLAMLPSSNLCG